MKDVADLILEMCDIDPQDVVRTERAYRLVLKAAALERVYAGMPTRAAVAARVRDEAAARTYACFGVDEERMYDALLASHGLVATT